MIRQIRYFQSVVRNNSKNPVGMDIPVMIYHKHSQKTKYYHKHWKTWSVAKALESIKQHDKYVLDIAG